MTADLVAFLRARFDDDERPARAATAGPWRHNPDKHWRKPGTSWFEEAVFAGAPGEEAVCVAGTGETDDPQSMADAAFIAHHHPARVLAEVAAKRAVVDAYAEAEEAVDGVRYPTTDVGRAEGLETAVLLLAQPYAGHPDYRPEWAPDA